MVVISQKTLKKHQKLTKTVSDQLKNSRLASSSSSQLKHLLSSSLPSSGSMHHQDPLEAALLAAARGQHGAGIPGNVIRIPIVHVTTQLKIEKSFILVKEVYTALSM